MREVTADGVGLDHGPGAAGLLEVVGQLHHSGAAFYVKRDLGLGLISLYIDLLNFSIEGAGIQIAPGGEVTIDGASDRGVVAGRAPAACSERPQQQNPAEN